MRIIYDNKVWMLPNNITICLPPITSYLLCGGYLLNWTQHVIDVISDQMPISHHTTTVPAIRNLQECQYTLLK